MNDFWRSVGILSAMAIAVAFMLPAFRYATSIFMATRGHRAAVALFAALLIAFAGAKHGPKVVEKPSWMNVTAACDTNTWDRATFTISSTGVVGPDTPLYIDLALAGDQTTNWQTHVSTTWENRPGVVSFASLSPSNPTNYIVRIRCDASPIDVTIKDFAAVASETQRLMTCTFTAPTNLVGKTAIVEVQRDPEIFVWVPVGTFEVSTNNSVTVQGNFISNGQNRRVRVRVEDVIIMGDEE